MLIPYDQEWQNYINAICFYIVSLNVRSFELYNVIANLKLKNSFKYLVKQHWNPYNFIVIIICVNNDCVFVVVQWNNNHSSA
jgi:hypothetical protein